MFEQHIGMSSVWAKASPSVSNILLAGSSKSSDALL